MTITTLLVDDAPDVRMMLRIALRGRGGFDVIGEADTAARAVELATELRPDVVVLDLGLPDLDAREVMGRIRRASPTSRVVVFSGRVSDRPWFEQRAAGYVVKGADLEDLIDLLSDVGAEQTHDEAALELPDDVLSVGEARGVVRDLLERWGYRELIDDAELVVSELVTNAVVHADSGCAVIVNRGEGGIRIEVQDQGPGWPDQQSPAAGAETGRGLMIVSALSTAWGIQAAERSKSVWVELTVDA
jgi:CheY-like chemotaxis protein